jgi:hypothetical protein
MKISIGSRLIDGPWGGGNQFALSLSEYLKDKGWEVVSDLLDHDIDIILMTEPRITSASGLYNQRQISKYVFRHPDTLVVHRINECDERKNTVHVNRYLKRANRAADHTVFISGFLKDLFAGKGFIKGNPSSVILNGANSRIFNSRKTARWDGCSALRLVTHHWGCDPNKGFDIYCMLDEIESIGGIPIEFTYIGRVPSRSCFKNTRVIPPRSGRDLSEELKKNHIYVTGSINEPAGMHHIEGAMCGLPLIFRNSGALPEYCRGFGVMFEGPDDFLEKMRQLISGYDTYFKALGSYPHNSEKMCSEYMGLFESLLERKNACRRGRRARYLRLFVKESILFWRDLIIIFSKKARRKLHDRT